MTINSVTVSTAAGNAGQVVSGTSQTTTQSVNLDATPGTPGAVTTNVGPTQKLGSDAQGLFGKDLFNATETASKPALSLLDHIKAQPVTFGGLAGAGVGIGIGLACGPGAPVCSTVGGVVGLTGAGAAIYGFLTGK
jgi:hypothetical protein